VARRPFASVKSTVDQQSLDLAVLSSSLSTDEPGAFGGILPTDAGLVAQTEDHGPLPDHLRRP
jgi:hypothetical protein